MSAYRSLARAMLRGFLRDRGSLIFTVALPVLFLVLLGSIYKGSSAPQVKVAEIGRVPLLDQAVRSAQLRAVLKVSRAASRASALQKVRQGDVDAAVSQQGDRLILHYSIADQVTSGVVRALFSSLVQAANQEATGKPPAFTLATAQVEDTSLKPIQYLAPGLLGLGDRLRRHLRRGDHAGQLAAEEAASAAAADPGQHRRDRRRPDHRQPADRAGPAGRVPAHRDLAVLRAEADPLVVDGDPDRDRRRADVPVASGCWPGRSPRPSRPRPRWPT